jgi:hypothetical protein
VALVAGRRGPGTRSLFVRLLLAGLAAVLGAAAASPAATAADTTGTAGASITNVVITETDSPTFEGLSFGDVGHYEYLAGYIEGEVDPDNPRNALIVNLDGAPRNADGNVEYRVDLAILKPIDLSRGNGRILYDVNNRGNKYALGHRINGAPGNGTNEAPLAEHAGTGFLMEEGYTIVWSGWQGDLTPGGGRLLAHFPIARNADGSPIVQLHREEFIFGDLTSPATGSLTYPAATLDRSQATLTVRQHERDPRVPVETWEYLDDRQIEITRPDSFDAGAIYEFIYPAQDPIVMGLGFAATRDIVSFLRHDTSEMNPLVGAIDKALGIGISQSGRYLRDFIYWGFNADVDDRAVFDGVVPIVAGSRRTAVNVPFSIPGNYSRQHENHTFPDDQFPFTYEVFHDPISGRTDGILGRCEADGVCPKIFQVDTDTEIFQARASLVVTDTSGAPLTLPDNVRAYLIAGSQHSPAATASLPEEGQQLSNPLDYDVHIRALITALDEWVTDDRTPPDTRYPSVADDTLVPPDDFRAQFPDIPDFTYPGLVNELRLLDYSVQPPAEGAPYPVLVGAKDADGNNVAGVRHPFLAAPTGTHTGWNLRREGFAEGALLGLTGSYIPFARTPAERVASGDERPSLEERYPSRGGYVRAVVRAAIDLVRDRLLLPDDARRIIAEASRSPLGQPGS